jgi:aspartyl-tRNA(Asn)/glutamyl-tRNA(Gln) amidotransferase subunit A
VCDLAIGTDTGGSIRIPAAYCGIVGLKPSYGLVPEAGVFPLSPRCDHAGTLTSTVAGTAELLAVLAGSAEIAGAGTASRPAFTVGVLGRQLADPSVTPEVAGALSAAIAVLERGGWEVRQVSAPWLDQLGRWEQTLAVIVAREAYVVHASRDTSGYAAGTRALLEYGASVTGEQFERALAEQAELTAAVQESLTGVDALIGPTVGYQAPEQDPPFGLGDDNAEGRFTGPYNLTGDPALSLPVPVPVGSLPVGMQFAGGRGADAALLQVAAAAERLLAAERLAIA